ncbi:hypothetical protein PLICRDRAFT_166180 [Plicaturopsis crispa FD-325 SS-3]|nr:hypothetical protein PLICRDRAFT_166180 [Plicaturopsis crispa FD-325 SS-3]
MSTPSPLATIPLNDGTQIPWIAFGSGTALLKADVVPLIPLAIKNGLTHLDTAQMYKNEESVGEGIALADVPRESLYITTKLDAVKEGYTVRTQLEESLRKLRVSYVDLFLVHTPIQHKDLKAVWREMEEVQKAGLTKSIGVSNFKVEHLKEILDGASAVPAVHQMEYHPYVLKHAEAVHRFNKEHGIVTASYSGLVPVTRAPEGPLTPVLESVRQRLETVQGKPVTAVQVLIKWLLQQDIVFVTTTSKEARIHEYLEAAALPPLSPDELQEIEKTGHTFFKRVYGKRIFGDE